jgi:hypothetical protein
VRVQQLETNPLKADNHKEEEDDDDGFQELEDVVYGFDGLLDNIRTNENRLCRRLHKNKIGMRGNKNWHNQGNDDPYAKIKFTILPFHGKYDVEEYLDWGIIVQQKFASHLVLDRHKVRQATSEFNDFAIIWWASLQVKPNSWDVRKEEIHDRFVFPLINEICVRNYKFKAGRYVCTRIF